MDNCKCDRPPGGGVSCTCSVQRMACDTHGENCRPYGPPGVYVYGSGSTEPAAPRPALPLGGILMGTAKPATYASQATEEEHALCDTAVHNLKPQYQARAIELQKAEQDRIVKYATRHNLSWAQAKRSVRAGRT